MILICVTCGEEFEKVHDKGRGLQLECKLCDKKRWDATIKAAKELDRKQ